MTAVEYTKTVINGLKNWVVKQIGKAKSELSEQIVRPDWNQNDETAGDYVKNRTHYMISPAIIADKSHTITLPAWSKSESEHDKIPFVLGQAWSTNYSDYSELPVQQADDGTLYIGTYPDVNNIPFYITSTKMKANSSWLSLFSPDACVLTPGDIDARYKTIPEEYFPDTIFKRGNAPVNYGIDANGNKIETATIQGDDTTASGNASHAEGSKTTASGNASHAEGSGTIASGYCSHAEGNGTIANGMASHAEGYYNAPHSNARPNVRGEGYLHAIGNGWSDKERSNAYTLDWSGNAWFAGSVSVGNIFNIQKLATVKEVDAKYTKPDDGIPKADLASDVQTSLSRADTLTDEYINNLINAALEAMQT